MVTFKHSRPFYNPTRRIHQLLLAAAMAFGVGLSGATAEISGSTLTLGFASAQAQTQVTDAEVMNYASSVLEMEGPRVQALNQIRDLLEQVNYDISQVDMNCRDLSSFNRVPRQVRSAAREIAVNYCNQARAIAEDNGLPSRRFNLITEAHQSDPNLAERIRAAMTQLIQNQP